MKEILIFGIGICLGLSIGFLIKARYVIKFKDYSGTIYVNRDKVTEKIVYQLELDDFPEKLQFKKLVIFKVDNTDT